MVELFRVRHHSPAAAHPVARRITDHPPAAVLIEGPTEYNQHIKELMFDHELPVMLYSWAPIFPDAPENSTEWDIRRDSFYPLTDYSPEWVALRTAHWAGVPVEFIDLSWLAFADTAVAENRYVETLVAKEAADRLIREFGADDMAGPIDELIEIDPELSLESYRERIGLLESILRGEPDRETKTREAHMVHRITDARRRFGGDMLVVCGAAHVDGLEALLLREVEPVDVWMPPADDNRCGIALTPTSYMALDTLDGYDAGQPNPGFCDRLCRDRAEGRHDTSEELLGQVVLELRRARQFVSPADLIAVQAITGALARLRGHQQIWRTDLVKGITTVLIKDDSGRDHPLLAHVNDALRGDRLGYLATGTRQLPLTLELRAGLEALGLLPAPKRREKSADLLDDLGLRRSQLLHSLVVLDIPGIGLATSADNDGVERWFLVWTPAFEGSLVKAAQCGGSQEQAVTAHLLERVADITSDLAAAANLVLEATLCRVARLSVNLQARTETLLVTSADLMGIGAATGVLMWLYRYDPILRATDRVDLGRLSEVAFNRSVRLLERLPPLPGGPELEGFIQAVYQLTDSAERVGEDLDHDIDSYHQALPVVVGNDRQTPTVRGAALGAQWLTGTRPDPEIAGLPSVIALPEQLDSFVAGLLGVAREATLRRPDALPRLDDILTGLDDAAFFTSLPGLWRAFSRCTQRERFQVAQLILGETAGSTLLDSSGSAGDATAVAKFESTVAKSLDRFLGRRHG